ncbi:HNH endonuclease [Gemmata obscuriglobus]|uniref:HNH endonuclease n=1 Tax=Gemmata obscuriglobus TaxID=114 RepID=UPI00016C38EE|nr:HNH endonuclease [Gemmata obscuriglobus]QEG32157.1 HNH endonuclease [Gemmata obscuriglobus]VTS11510.1 hnh endonuclease : HNH endonuclease OS=Candidatus Entotheonella sp. TSY2 GN=ETSY2_40875 PE=4 SV=1: HNH [Gemmata obscuriglobus UQM 2246]
MSAFSEVRRSEVATRAGHRCEYCHLPTRGQVATFPIDHILPRRDGGTTDLSNLALTCPHCNAHKWTAATGSDPETGETAALFNPRIDDWELHFAWADDGSGALRGRTATARATISALGINDTDMLALRILLAELGLFPESAGG